ncbi:uncharacterized protein LOC125583207 [Brassica napus]|uniref:uncharacterized protein LOC125583207 n=1 Tax=Brassica napus TaxID=3708 RepID=UPI002079EDFA|nr:uncharacterized protein LOC125583207 [Brassica napus]
MRKNHNFTSQQVEELKEKVEGLYLDDDATTEEISKALKELSAALKAEEMFWRQKSRVLWLREGDRNSKYFHALEKQRRARNRITQLLDENGNIVEDEEGLVAIATSYFRQIFESYDPEDIAEALSEVPTTITGSINADLTVPVTEWEVLPQRISETQSAFVAGRQITDNIMIAQEMFHALRTKPGGRVKRMAIKTDMSKAYDRMVPANVRQQIKDTLGIQNEGGMGSYLGIPEDISGSKCKLFAFLKEKLLHRVNGWTGRWLSKGGKEVLIKSILLALPTYVMSNFLLPLEICENLASAIAQFWWSSNPPKRGVHWAKWEKMCAPREEGGIGFHSLVARVLRGRYYRLSSPLRMGTVDTPSYVWTSISSARKLLLLGIRSKVHSGYEINVWEDPWIPTMPAKPASARAPAVNPKMLVSSLINSVTKEWDTRLLEQYVAQEDIPMIQSLAISPTHRRDTFCWSYTKTGQYTVKSGYWVATNLMKDEEELEVLQSSIIKLQAFAWKIAVTRNLVRRNMRCDNYCPRCGAPEETVTHAIFECPPALQAWELSQTPSSFGIFPVSTRNDKLFRGINRDPLELVRYAECECQAWYNARDSVPVLPNVQTIEEPQVLSLGCNGEDTTHGVKELTEEGDIVTLGTGSFKVGNGEHDTTLDLSRVWDGLQGSDSNDGTATRLAQLLN